MVLFQGFQSLGPILGFINRDGDHFKVAIAVHPVDQHKFGHFRHTWAAPGRPKVDQPIFFRLIFREILDDL